MIHHAHVIGFGTLLHRHGGALRTRELLEVGYSERAIRAAVADGRLTRIRQGWFIEPGLDEAARAALRAGGVLTCAVALEAHGIWSVPDGRVHIRRPRHASAPRTPPLAPTTTVHWRPGSGSSRLVSDPLDALGDYRCCADPIVVLAAVDSTLRQLPAQRTALRERGLLHPSTDGVCESGIEFVLWHRLLRRTGARRQVMIPTVGRVDFLIGDRLVIEVDGRGFHDAESSFEADRRRDAALSTLGYRVLRFSYRQVMHCFGEVENAIRAAIARRDHY